MRTAMVVVCVLLLVTVASAWADLVIHDDSSGPIVATDGGFVLLSNGQVWQMGQYEWYHQGNWDPPVPVEDIRFWGPSAFVTFDGEGWMLYQQYLWFNIGQLPDSVASVAGEPGFLSASVSPNPTPGTCHVSFSLSADSPVSIEVIDATGRLVRRLLDGPHPAGEYSLKWDGKDDAGRELPAGVYLTHVTTAEGTTAGRVVLTR